MENFQLKLCTLLFTSHTYDWTVGILFPQQENIILRQKTKKRYEFLVNFINRQNVIFVHTFSIGQSGEITGKSEITIQQ